MIESSGRIICVGVGRSGDNADTLARFLRTLGYEKVPVYIPKNLYGEIERRVESSRGEFKSVEEYVEFVLREVVKEEEPEEVYTPEEEREVKQRLRSLGYL